MAVPPPVPVLPDAARIVVYAAVASAGPFAIPFAIYGDGTDFTNWVQITLNGGVSPAGWTVSSPSGSLATLARPITDAVVTFSLPITGTLQITGARRPRRTTVLNENQGESSRSRNQIYNDIIAMAREGWDLRERIPLAPPGETLTWLPKASLRAGNTAFWDLAGNLTYMPPGVPLGIPGFVSLKATYGAVGNGVANDTAALLAANAVGGYCWVEPGTYVIDNVVLTNLKGLMGLGNPNFIPSSNVPTGVTQSFLMLFSGAGCNNAIVTGIQISASKVTYPNLYLLCASGTDSLHFINNTTIGGGIGIYGANCTNHYVEHNTIAGYATKGISHDGAGQNNINIIQNFVNGTGSNNHAISQQLGGGIHVHENFIVAAGFFGISAFQAIRVEICNNECFNSLHEGINTEDTSTAVITSNLCYWDVGASIDFGMSIFGNAADNQFNTVADNLLINSNSAGIALAKRVSFSAVTGNLVLNCCRAGTSGGIQLTGSNCLKNTVANNYCIDTIGALQRSGVQEVDVGTGLPSLNRIERNVVDGWSARAIEHVNAIIPASIAANTDNYAPLNGRSYDNWNISSTAPFNITGIADGWADRMLNLYNGGANTITLKNNVTSAAGNRFFLGADFALAINTSISVRWRSDVGGGVGGWVKV